MPELDGIESIKRVKKICPDIMITAVTNHDPERLFDAIQVGECHGVIKFGVTENPDFFNALPKLVLVCKEFSQSYTDYEC